MGKIKRFVTKPRNCDAFATIGLFRCPGASSRCARQGSFLNEDDAEFGPLLCCAALLAAHVNGTGRAAASRAERALRLVRLSGLRSGRLRPCIRARTTIAIRSCAASIPTRASPGPATTIIWSTRPSPISRACRSSTAATSSPGPRSAMRSTGRTCSISAGSACRAACSRRRSRSMTGHSTSSTPASIAAAISSSPRATRPGRGRTRSGCPNSRAASIRASSSTTTARPGWSITARRSARRAMTAIARSGSRSSIRARCGPSGPRRLLVDGGVNPAANPVWIEGPHLLKVGGYYYLTCAEGGTAEGHSQVVLRSRNVTGPYLPDPAQPDPDPARPAARPPLSDHLRRPCPAGRDARMANGGRPSSPTRPYRRRFLQYRAGDLPAAGALGGRLAANHRAGHGDSLYPRPAQSAARARRPPSRRGKSSTALPCRSTG